MSSFGASGGADPFSSLAQQPAGPDWPNMVSPHVLRGRSRSNNSPPLGLNQNNGSEQAPRGEIPGEAAASAGNNNAAAAAMAVGIPAENNHPFLGNNNDEQDDGNDGYVDFDNEGQRREGDDEDVDESGSNNLCVITQTYPCDPCFFLGVSRHVFERSALLRLVAVTGMGRSFREVKHPLDNVWMPREQAVNHITPVSEDLRAVIHRLRASHGYPDSDETPFTEHDQRVLDTTIQRVQQPVVNLAELNLPSSRSSDSEDSQRHNAEIEQWQQRLEQERRGTRRSRTRSTGRSNQRRAAGNTNTNNRPAQAAARGNDNNGPVQAAAGGTANNRPAQVAAQGNANNHPAPARGNGRIRMGDFTVGNEMKSDVHKNAFISLLQLVDSHPGGYSANFRGGNRQRFLERNINALYADTGPLSAFRPKQVQGLMISISRALQVAINVWNRNHSDGDGGRHEDVPRWVEVTMGYIDGATSEPAANEQQANAVRDNAAISRSLIGAQARLGEPNANLLDERTRNNMGGGGLRSRHIGNVETERVPVDPPNHGVEGSGDSRIILPARQNGGQNQNRTRRRNVNLPPTDNTATLTGRYNGLNGTLASIEFISRDMASAANQMMISASQPPVRSFGEMAGDYERISAMMTNNTNEDSRAFLGRLLQGLQSEAQYAAGRFICRNPTPGDDNSGGNNAQDNNEDGRDDNNEERG